MSYILEALKKADQERVVGAVPNLATPHAAERPRTRSHRWVWMVAALLCVNVLLAVMLLKDRHADVPATAQALPEPQPPRSVVPAAQPVQQTREITISEAPTPEKAALPDNGRTLSRGELVVLPEPGFSRRSDLSPAPATDFAVGPDADAATKDISQLQRWYELPSEFRNRLSLPRLDLHAWSEEPQNRFILVNLKKYREGERLESGLILEEILPDGMVLSYRGERFLLEK